MFVHIPINLTPLTTTAGGARLTGLVIMQRWFVHTYWAISVHLEVHTTYLLQYLLASGACMQLRDQVSAM
jgi:hypothetical protein